MTSFDQPTQLDKYMMSYFQSLDEFVVATNALNKYLQASAKVEMNKTLACKVKMLMLNDLVAAMLHTSFLLAGMRHSLMNIPTFAKYAEGHMISQYVVNFDEINQEIN